MMKVSHEITEFFNGLISAVEKATGHKLDRMPETLPILDYYCQLYRTRRNEKIASGGRDISEDIGRLVAPMAGAYFGEVVRGKFECFWHAPQGQYDIWRLQFKRCFLFFNPVAVADEVLNGKDSSYSFSGFMMKPEDENSIKNILDSWNHISSNDYYTFSMRYEILDFIHEKLISTHITQNISGKGFKSKTYNKEHYENYIKQMKKAQDR